MSGRERLLRRAVGQVALLLLFAVALGGVLLLVGATLQDPAWLHLAWAASILLFLDLRATARREGIAGLHGDPRSVSVQVEDHAPGWRFASSTLTAWAFLLLAVACARPQWGLAETPVQRRGVDIFLCVDVSRSMLAEDVKPNRLVRARLAIDSLLEQLSGDRIGLIAYAGEARVLCPLTLDHSAARLFLETLDPAVLQRPGTAIGGALDLAGRTLAEEGGRHGVIVLFTDGEDHAGEVMDVAESLAEDGVVIHAIGVGQGEGVPIPIRSEDDTGRPGKVTGFVKDRSGSAVMTKLDASTLSAIAGVTGGQFVPIQALEPGLAAIGRELASMERQDYESTRTLVRTDRHVWFTVPALLLLALRAAFPDGATLRRHRRRRERVVAWRESARDSRVA